jgi:hypothetical protein
MFHKVKGAVVPWCRGEVVIELACELLSLLLNFLLPDA